MRKLSLNFAFLAILILFPLSLLAQDNSSMTGLVTDATGAVVPGTTVALSNTHIGVNYTQKTDSKGTYLFANVPPATGYTVKFTRSGFATVTFTDVALSVGITRTQNAKLKAGTTEQVEVSAASSEVTINTSDASIGNNIDVHILNDLPVQDRTSGIEGLFYLQPGVDSDSGAVTGARTDQSSVTLDGMDMNDIAAGTTFAINGFAPIDAVEEFRGTVAGLVPSLGTGSGGQFQLVTKSGTNQFHGNLNEYNRNTDTEANSWYDNNLGLPRSPYIRNQFGGNIGGPFRKDKGYFFFNFGDSRIIQSTTVEPTVPLDSYRNGTLNYILASDANGNACPDSSRLNVNPQCIGNLSGAQVTALDPGGIGFDQPLLTTLNARYPHANDLTAGDGVNTGGYAFKTPVPDFLTTYVGRVDYNLTPNQRIFARVNIARQNAVESAILFPTDPSTHPYIDRSYSYVVSHIWQIGANKVNQFYYGDTISKLNFPFTYNPTGANQYSLTGLSGPYSGGGGQQRRVPIPEFRDDFNWHVHSHNLTVGGTFKFIKTDSFLQNNFNFVGVGQTGSSLGAGLDPSVRPGLIGPGNTATADYDSLFSTALGVIGDIGSNFDYTNTGSVITQGLGSHRNYRYFETELYAGDTWKVTPHLTVTYGVRYQLYSVPYETHGAESVPFLTTLASGSINPASFDTYISDRVTQSAAGASGDASLPLFAYRLGGKANKGPNLYNPSYKDIAPRVAFAYSPAWAPKIVFNAGANIVYDRTVINAVNFIQDQESYLFQGSNTNQFGSPNGAVASLAVDPRIGANLGFDSTLLPTAPVISNPFLPYVDGNGTPYGLAASSFSYNVDPNLKDPYSIALNGGIQQELPGHFVLKASYVGRLGRRLLAQADASQLIDFPDLTSGQLLSQAFGNLSLQARAGVPYTNVTSQPWFENVIPNGIGAALAPLFGIPGVTTNTQFVDALFGILANRGDFADSVEALSYYSYNFGLPLLASNIGMASQQSINTFITNKGSSNYHGLLLSLDKNLSNGLQFNVNYTWSHSIDNTSLVANSIAANTGAGFICDVLRIRECRGNSDFDIQQMINAHFVYDLPFGHGRQFLATTPKWLDQVIGGWSFSGIPSYRTGLPLTVYSDAFVAGYASDAPALFTGNKNDLRAHVNKQNGSYFQFTNPQQAFSDFQGPIGFQIGHRNDFRGPGAFNFDAGLAKSFPIVGDRVVLKVRADAFNVLNHPTYAGPGLNIGSDSNFGKIGGGPGGGLDGYAPRVAQFSGRLEF